MPTWLITGANRGLGLEFATQLSADPLLRKQLRAVERNTIITTTRSPCHALESLKSKSDGKFHVLELDTSSEASITKFGAEVSSILSAAGAKIDYLLNNAGINGDSKQTSLDMTSDALMKHMSTNVFGPARIVQVLLPYLRSGSVVMNMTSGLASLGCTSMKETPECTVYAMSKAALNMLTVHQAAQLKEKGVKVICMDPGWVKTDMGGEGAVLEKDVSIKGMLKVLRGLKEGDEGKFFCYDGSEVGW